MYKIQRIEIFLICTFEKKFEKSFHPPIKLFLHLVRKRRAARSKSIFICFLFNFINFLIQFHDDPYSSVSAAIYSNLTILPIFLPIIWIEAWNKANIWRYWNKLIKIMRIAQVNVEKCVVVFFVRLHDNFSHFHR